MAPRLKTLADQIEQEFPDLTATLEQGYCNTDHKPRGVRWRIPGKGRYGNKLVVRRRGTTEVVYSHNAAETYRHNSEVVHWIEAERQRRQATLSQSETQE